jgi:hypothetical protein
VQRCERVDAAVECFVSFARGLEPIAHRMAAHEARADLFTRELVEKFLLIGDRKNTAAYPPAILELAAAQTELNRRRIQFNRGIAAWFLPSLNHVVRAYQHIRRNRETDSKISPFRRIRPICNYRNYVVRQKQILRSFD